MFKINTFDKVVPMAISAIAAEWKRWDLKYGIPTIFTLDYWPLDFHEDCLSKLIAG